MLYYKNQQTNIKKGVKQTSNGIKKKETNTPGNKDNENANMHNCILTLISISRHMILVQAMKIK